MALIKKMKMQNGGFGLNVSLAAYSLNPSLRRRLHVQFHLFTVNKSG